jgi:hypothetical protein
MDTNDGSPRLLLFLVLLLVSFCYLVWAALMCWTLKDGLGPDAIESTGLLAISRFWADMKWHMIIGSIPLLMALALIPSCFRDDAHRGRYSPSSPIK